MIWDTLQALKFEYRLRVVVKIIVPVDLRKELQNRARIVHLLHFVVTLGAQMRPNVSLGAFKWESGIVFCFVATG